MKRILLICTALLAGYARAEVYVKNHTRFPISVWVTWYAPGANESFCTNGFCTEGSTVFEPNSEGLVKTQQGNPLQDHAWSKVRYQIFANKTGQPLSATRDWVPVYDTQTDHPAKEKYEAGGYRNLTVFNRLDDKGNEVFDIDDSLR